MAMDQFGKYWDTRQTIFCAYCGGLTETRDHVPSRVFLDKPYPSNLPVVPACKACNQSFSKDEEYVACLVECVLSGSGEPDQVEREKIKRILRRKPALAARLRNARQETSAGTSFMVETERVQNVVLKLARGHAAFELNEPQLDDPSNLSFLPFPSMDPTTRERFEAPFSQSGSLAVWPEVGSRAMQRLVNVETGASAWIPAQPGRYRYLTSLDGEVAVRIVIGEYLACEVNWSPE